MVHLKNKTKQKTNQDMKMIMEGISPARACGGRGGTDFTMPKLHRLYTQM
jgi:hypothetical protein